MSADMPEPGDMAPDFTLARDGGTNVSLADLRGAPVVLFFYPKASTPGCTIEARDFTRLLADFRALGAHVLGASRDSVKRQENFAAKEDLAIPLLSDTEGTLCADYGVWAEKKNYGKTYMGIVRSTFLIDREGRIACVWRNVRVNGHAEEVLAALGEL